MWVIDLFQVVLKLPEKYKTTRASELLATHYPEIYHEPACVIAPSDTTVEQESIVERPNIVFNLCPSSSLFRCQYSLVQFVETLGVRGVVDVVHYALMEQKILFHSTELSLLPMVCECLRALMYPFPCSAVYIPVVPATLMDLVEAPVPYILGVHSDWLSKFNNEHMTEVLIVDCDSGFLRVGMDCRVPVIPKLPDKVDRWLMVALNHVVGFSDPNILSGDPNFCPSLQNNRDIQSIIQILFLDSISSLLFGLPECLIFLDSEYPVFNKSLFLREFVQSGDREFVTHLVETQLFDRLISIIQTPNLSFFCMGMQRNEFQLHTPENKTSDKRNNTGDIQEFIFPAWIYSRAPSNMISNIKQRFFSGEPDIIEILLKSRLEIYSYDANGNPMVVDDQASNITSTDVNRSSDKASKAIATLEVVLTDESARLKQKRLSHKNTKREPAHGLTLKRDNSLFGIPFWGVSEQLGQDFVKTIERNLSVKKLLQLHRSTSIESKLDALDNSPPQRRGGIALTDLFLSDEALVPVSHSDSFDVSDSNSSKGCEYNKGSGSDRNIDMEDSEQIIGSLGSFVSELVIDPPIVFDKHTFDNAAKKTCVGWTVADVAHSAKISQMDIINAFNKRSSGHVNRSLRASFVEGGSLQADSTLPLVETILPTTVEGKAIADLFRHIHMVLTIRFIYLLFCLHYLCYFVV